MITTKGKERQVQADALETMDKKVEDLGESIKGLTTKFDKAFLPPEVVSIPGEFINRNPIKRDNTVEIFAAGAVVGIAFAAAFMLRAMGRRF